jgi:polyisoprenoid-binding protein YceI
MTFLAVESYPKLRFEATNVVRGGRGLIGAGVLAVRDRRVSLELPVASYESGDSLVLGTTTSLSRQATGLDWNLIRER